MGVDADDLPDRSFAPVGAGALGEGESEPVPQVGLEAGVVGLGGGDDRRVQGPPVDGEPLAGLAGLDLVRDGDVGVQVGVSGAGVAVGEPGGDEPGHLDLPDPVGPFAGVQDVVLDERQGVGDGGVVGLLDLRGDLRRRERPQRAD